MCLRHLVYVITRKYNTHINTHIWIFISPHLNLTVNTYSYTIHETYLYTLYINTHIWIFISPHLYLAANTYLYTIHNTYLYTIHVCIILYARNVLTHTSMLSGVWITLFRSTLYICIQINLNEGGAKPGAFTLSMSGMYRYCIGNICKHDHDIQGGENP